MAGRVFELYEDFSPSWLTEGLSKMKISIMENRGFLIYVSIKQKEGFTYMKTFSPLWRLFSIRQIEGLSLETFYMKTFSPMADRGFEQDEDLPLLWKTETCLHLAQRVGVIWRLVSIMADRGFELYGDLFSIMPDRGFEQDEDLPPLWKKEGLTYMKTFLHYGRQSGVCLHYSRKSVSLIWRIVSIMADRDFALHEDFFPLWQIKGLRGFPLWLIWRLVSIMPAVRAETCLRLIWRLFSIMADRGFEQDEDLPPL